MTCTCRGCTSGDYGAEYRRRQTMCRLAVCEAKATPRYDLCEQHLSDFRAWAREHRRHDSGAQMEWMQAHGGGWWDPRPAAKP